MVILGLIKRGKQTANIYITLRNQGPDAYKQDEYGEHITVRRTLKMDGSGSYQIKNQEGIYLMAPNLGELVNIVPINLKWGFHAVLSCFNDFSNFLFSRKWNFDKC